MTSESLLQVDGIEIIYEKVILAVKNISLKVNRQNIVALIGANGAGKSTTLKAISGLAKVQRGEITKGRIHYLGKNITYGQSSKMVQSGLVQVLEGRHCFPHLTIEENLLTGAFVCKSSRSQLKEKLERIYHYFPRIKTLRNNLAGFASGGEQQMVAIGRALIGQPELVLLDEPSMGLAPLIVEEIFEIIKTLRDEQGLSFLLAEQNATMALRYADYAYVLENGQLSHEGTAQQIIQSGDIAASYLGDNR